MSTTIFKYMKKAPENVSHLHFHQILHFFSLLSCNKKILYVTLDINKGVVNRYMFIAPFAFIKKGDLNVGITLKQLYEQTKVKFKLSVLAANDHMNREVSRLYYMEDTKISGWTRHGELIVSTLMTYHTECRLKEFIDSFLPYDPPGIMINLGGYINEIPKSIIDYCEKIHMPLLVFPWEIYLQDIMQTFTNMIFENQQKEQGISSLFSCAIFNSNDPSSYEPALINNGFKDKFPYHIAILKTSDISEVEYHFFRSELSKLCENLIYCQKNDQLIMIFYLFTEPVICSYIEAVLKECHKAFKTTLFEIGIGSRVLEFQYLKQSYDRALLCQSLCDRAKSHILSFEGLGILGILMTSDPTVLQSFYLKTLESITDYDNKNGTDYIKTLQAYITHNKNTAKISKELFIHRNTVNYRLNKIEELFALDLNDLHTITNFQIAFHILSLFEHTNL